MSLQGILDAIRAAGEAEIRTVETQSKARAHEILAQADEESQDVREDARLKASMPAGKERARILHRAHQESLYILGNVREALVEATLDQAHGRLANLRTDPAYPTILRRLMEEALAELENSSSRETGQAVMEADARDRLLLSKLIHAMDLTLTVNYSLNCWGGVIVHDEKNQVVVINTLEARLQRATPYLRHLLASFYEDNQVEPEISHKNLVLT